MKRFIFTILCTMSILFAFIFSVNAQSLGITYVDLQRVMLESDKGKEAKNSLTFCYNLSIVHELYYAIFIDK